MHCVFRLAQQTGRILQVCWWLAIAMCLSGYARTTETHDIILRPGIGQLEKHLGQYCSVTNVAHLIFVIELPESSNATYETEIDCGKLTNNRLDLQNCRVSRPLLMALFKMCREGHNMTRTEINRIYDLLTEVETNSSSNSRKRAILESVGNVISGIFGLSTTKQLEHIQHVVGQLEQLTIRASTTLDTSSGRLSKIIQAQGNRLDTLHSILEKESNISSNLYRQFNILAVNLELNTHIQASALNFISSQIKNMHIMQDLIQGFNELLRADCLNI